VGDDEQEEVQRWLFFGNHKLTATFASYRFLKAFGAAAPDPAVMAWLRARLDNAFGVLERQLAGRAFVAGVRPTVADLSICGYRFYPVEESGHDLCARFANVAAWLDRVQALPGWADPYDILPGVRTAPRW
jgi:glutathione S-transferase